MTTLTAMLRADALTGGGRFVQVLAFPEGGVQDVDGPRHKFSHPAG